MTTFGQKMAIFGAKMAIFRHFWPKIETLHAMPTPDKVTKCKEVTLFFILIKNYIGCTHHRVSGWRSAKKYDGCTPLHPLALPHATKPQGVYLPPPLNKYTIIK